MDNPRNRGTVSDSFLRRLGPEDIEQAKYLCSDCFPIEYSDQWFNYITSSKVFSLGFFLPIEDAPKGQLVSMLIAEEQPLKQVEGDVGPILASASCSTTVMYIISLGVLSQHRKQGHGSLLINSLLQHVSSLPSCSAVYLHVQASNSSAQRFYNQVGFREFITVPNYYYIGGKQEDAFLYCCFTNGGVVFPNTVRGYAVRYYEETCQCLVQTCSAFGNIFKRYHFSSP